MQEWFDFEIPETKVAADFIQTALQTQEPENFNLNKKVIWLGNLVSVYEFDKKWTVLEFAVQNEIIELKLKSNQAVWLIEQLESSNLKTNKLKYWSLSYEEAGLGNFEKFFTSKAIKEIRKAGLVVV